jgi:hypothetical protein
MFNYLHCNKEVTVDNAMALMRNAIRLIQIVNGEGLPAVKNAIIAPEYSSSELCWLRAAHDHFKCCHATQDAYAELIASEHGNRFLDTRDRLWPDVVKAAKFMLSSEPDPLFYSAKRTTPMKTKAA